MPMGIVYVGMGGGASVVVVGPLSTSVLIYGGLSSIVAIIVVVGGFSEGGFVAKISNI